MDETALLERNLANLRAFVRALGGASTSSRVVELPGVTAAVVPATPGRSMPNSVVYEDATSLAEALDELARTYRESGVAAFTVWVPEADREAATSLERAGHVLDADPAAMARELAAIEAPVATPAQIEQEWDLAAVARLNDLAYPVDGNSFGPALERFPRDDARIYLARVADRAAACLMTLDAARDCGVYWVATLAEARGRGLATALMSRALADAHERGCTTSTLQATKVGEPIYARLGYRSLGALEMWERRPP